MEIKDVLSIENININIKGSTKKEVIDEMVQSLYDLGNINSIEDFKKDIYLREEEGITGIGKGIAIPHGRGESVVKTSIMVGRADHPIEWEACDDEPVRFVIMFAVRNVDMSQHIVLLSKVAVLLCDDDIINQLMISKSKEEIYNILGKGVS